MNRLVYSTSSLVSSSMTLCQLNLTREFAVVGRHSKNIALKKNKLDSTKTKLFNRISIKITMAAKMSGPDPVGNIPLSRALKEAHSHHLPKDTIERALKKATETTSEDFSHGVYELYGRGGVGFVVTTLTDSSNRAVKEIKHVAKKADVKVATSGSVLFSFDRKGVMKLPTLGKYDEDGVLEALMENGIDSFDSINKVVHDGVNDDAVITSYELLVAPDSIGAVHDALDVIGLGDGVTTSIEYFPNSDRVSVNDEDYEVNMGIIDELESIDDIDRVFHNMNLQ